MRTQQFVQTACYPAQSSIHKLIQKKKQKPLHNIPYCSPLPSILSLFQQLIHSHGWTPACTVILKQIETCCRFPPSATLCTSCSIQATPLSSYASAAEFLAPKPNSSPPGFLQALVLLRSTFTHASLYTSEDFLTLLVLGSLTQQKAWCYFNQVSLF